MKVTRAAYRSSVSKGICFDKPWVNVVHVGVPERQDGVIGMGGRFDLQSLSQSAFVRVFPSRCVSVATHLLLQFVPLEPRPRDMRAASISKPSFIAVLLRKEEALLLLHCACRSAVLDTLDVILLCVRTPVVLDARGVTLCRLCTPVAEPILLPDEAWWT